MRDANLIDGNWGFVSYCVLRNGDFGGRIVKKEKMGIMAG